MCDRIKHLVHALNYSTVMRILKYSESRFYNLSSDWDRLVFSSDLCINRSHEVAALLETDQSYLEKAFRDVIESFKRVELDDVLILTIRDENYPKKLHALKRPPAILFLRGEPRLLEKRTVAVVGTREPTETGAKRAGRVAMELSEYGFTIVSGLAKGVDTAAHTATIKSDGQTIAVIGSPIDIAYPPENYLLQQVIANGHLLISQFLLGQPIRQWNFPQRNNTMVGLSEATIIVEAKTTGGGAKIQGDLCLKAGRKLFIMKSFVSDQVPWIHEFIHRGAIVFDNIDTVINELNKNKEISQDKPKAIQGSFSFAASMLEE